MRMNNYIVTLKPILDSIKLRYPERETITLACKDFESRGYENIKRVNLNLKEEVDPFVTAWIFDGYGQADFAKGGGVYIKLTAGEIKKMLENTLNDLQSAIKFLTLEELIKPSFRDCLNNLLSGGSGIRVINSAESLDEITKKQWLYSEYERLLQDSAYGTTDWDNITIVYKVEDVVSYEETLDL